MYLMAGECFYIINREKNVNEMIEEIRRMVQKHLKLANPLVLETVLILDVLATMADRIQQLENRMADKGAANGSKKEESGLNIG